jgi:hypothetical protein
MSRIGVIRCVGALAWVLGAGCAGRGPNPAAAPPALPPGAGAPQFTDEQVEAARTLYIAKCTGCHKFYPPANYSAADWEVWMRKMSRKARLHPEQDALLRAYLELFRR